MSSDALYAQLHDPDPQVRIKAIRRIGAICELELIPDIVEVYENPSEPAKIRKAAEEALGQFKAVSVALDNDEDVVLPDPDAIKEPGISSDFLRRLMVMLGVLLAVLIALNVVVAVLPLLDFGGGDTGVTVTSGDDPVALTEALLARAIQIRADVAVQQQSWQQYGAIQTLGCDAFAPPASTSVNANDLNTLSIDPVQHQDLYQASSELIAAINGFTLVHNNWLIGCSADEVPVTSAQSMQALDAILVQLDSVEQRLAMLQEQTAATEAAQPTDIPQTETPEAEDTEVPTATVEPGVFVTTGPTVAYTDYFRGMRERIDAAAGARGVATQIEQYWQDVLTSGESFGCRTPLFADDIQPYVSITPEVAALDQRLNELQVTLNLGLQLTRDSLASFKQGCSEGTLGGRVGVGLPQAQQAIEILNQVSVRIDALQEEISQ